MIELLSDEEYEKIAEEIREYIVNTKGDALTVEEFNKLIRGIEEAHNFYLRNIKSYKEINDPIKNFKKICKIDEKKLNQLFADVRSHKEFLKMYYNACLKDKKITEVFGNDFNGAMKAMDMLNRLLLATYEIQPVESHTGPKPDGPYLAMAMMAGVWEQITGHFPTVSSDESSISDYKTGDFIKSMRIFYRKTVGSNRSGSAIQKDIALFRAMTKFD